MTFPGLKITLKIRIGYLVYPGFSRQLEVGGTLVLQRKKAVEGLN